MGACNLDDEEIDRVAFGIVVILRDCDGATGHVGCDFKADGEIILCEIALRLHEFRGIGEWWIRRGRHINLSGNRGGSGDDLPCNRDDQGGDHAPPVHYLTSTHLRKSLLIISSVIRTSDEQWLL